MRLIYFVVFGLCLMSCTKKISSTAEAPNVNAASLTVEQSKVKDILPAKDEKECTSQGGAWLLVGQGATADNVRTCHFIHTDHGKACLDGDECSSKICFANETGTGGSCGKFAKTSFCTFKKIMIQGKATDEKDCLVD